jgi:hypothetical protein
VFCSRELAGSGSFPAWLEGYLVAGDSLADDFGVFVDPDIGRSARGEHAGEDLAKHGK